MKQFSFDSKCLELAEHFLHEHRQQACYATTANELAQQIQDCVEDFCDELPALDPTPYCSNGHQTKEQCNCPPIAAND